MLINKNASISQRDIVVLYVLRLCMTITNKIASTTLAAKMLRNCRLRQARLYHIRGGPEQSD